MQILENTGNEIISSIQQLLATQPGPVVVVPHSNPDGDAIGAAYGLAVVLRNSGREVKIVSPNDYPSFLAWLSGEVEIINYLKKRGTAETVIRRSSIMFCIDFNEITRVDEMEKVVASFGGVKVLVDHHPDPTPFCDLMVSEPTYSSSAELVYDLVVALGLREFLDHRAAEALYTGIMTDTGSFSYSTNRPGLYRVLSDLMTFSLDTAAIHARVYDNYSADRMRLMGFSLLNKMVVLPEFRTAYIALTRQELKMFNFVPGDTEGFVNIPLSIGNIVFSVLFIEKENLVKVSFRSRGKFPSNGFAATHFSGGGHLNAAGGEDKATLEEVIARFTQLLPSYLHLLENADKDEYEKKDF